MTPATVGLHQSLLLSNADVLLRFTGTLNLFGQPAKTTPQDDDLKRATVIIEDAQANSRDGISFTEIMEGHMYVGSDIEEFEIAERVARGACSGARFFLSVHAWDTEARECKIAH